MSKPRQEVGVRWSELTGPTSQQLGHRDTIDWHYHDVPQLVYPSSGVLAISAADGTWVVPPQRAVWIPAGGRHAHRAHGPTQMRTLAFTAAARVGAQPRTSPAAVAVSPL